VRLRVVDELPRVFVDGVQIRQVLVNIIRNAVEAMDNSPRREIVVEAAPAGDALVTIAVTDTGPGIARHIADGCLSPS
jgi:two-component system, LuxR family, sensor kinase FixL